MKKHILNIATAMPLRIATGNGPIRVKSYKLTAYDLFEPLV